MQKSYRVDEALHRRNTSIITMVRSCLNLHHVSILFALTDYVGAIYTQMQMYDMQGRQAVMLDKLSVGLLARILNFSCSVNSHAIS